MGMPRPNRNFLDRVPLHIVNRGNRKQRIFHVDADYIGFLAAIVDAMERTVVRLLAFCLMPNHFHLVLWPYRGPEVSRFMLVLMNSHLRDLMPRHNLAGQGHVYQSRFHPFEIQNEVHFLNVCRYVESNALRANLTTRAEDWPWSSLVNDGPVPGISILSPWPVPRPRDWLEQVNNPPRILAAPAARSAWLPEAPPTSRKRVAGDRDQLAVTRTQSTSIITLPS
jgi:putative transposase